MNLLPICGAQSASPRRDCASLKFARDKCRIAGIFAYPIDMD